MLLQLETSDLDPKLELEAQWANFKRSIASSGFAMNMTNALPKPARLRQDSVNAGLAMAMEHEKKETR